MRRIQEVALDLFDERGFDRVTIEQIAEKAEVSPSSVYRYFGTKEQLVLHDEFDLQLLDVVQAELVSHPPVEAVRRAISTLMTAVLRPRRSSSPGERSATGQRSRQFKPPPRSKATSSPNSSPVPSPRPRDARPTTLTFR